MSLLVESTGRVGREFRDLDATVAFQADAMETLGDDGFPEVDDLVGGRFALYQMGRVVGRGSMSRVYEAQHLTLRRPCAVKILNPGLLERQPETREQFWSEARIVASLVHPNIVTVHNLGSERGYHFIEMEYVDGSTLRDVLHHEGPLDPLRASSLVHQVVEALGKAHDRGLVHRDIKPTNVLVTKSGQAKLADFGLVRRLNESRGGMGAVAGTPIYMAPELFHGSPATPRSDLYAVGAMYFHLLATRPPFHSDSIHQLIARHARDPVPDVRGFAPDLSDDVQGIIGRCLAKRPGDRYETATELAEDLRSLINGLQDTESLVREALEGLDCFVQGGNERYRVIFQLPNDRIQEVYLDVAEGRNKDRVLSVFSVCGVAEARHYEYLLRLNSKLTYGGLSIREVNGTPMFVMTRAYDRSRVTAEEIRAAMIEIAKRSDLLEQRISSGDVY